MGYVRRLATTGKVEISEKLKAEIETAYLYGIVQKINEHKIPSSMVINLDQTLSKFVPGCNKTLAKKGCKSVPIAGSTVKRMITATFSITLTGEFLPVQLIYALDEGKDIKDVEISLKLSIVKPLHAKWLIEMYNYMTSSEGRDVYLKGWKVASILDAAEKGLEELPNLDPFHDIDPLTTSDLLEEVDGNESETERSMYISPSVDKDDEDSEYEDEDGNIFDVSDEESDDE